MTLPDTKTRRWLALLFTVPLAFSLLFFLTNQIAEHIDVRFVQIQSFSSSFNRLLSLIKDAELGERGFLLTGDDRYLPSIQQANAWVPGEISLCRTYIKDRPSLRPKVEEIIRLVQTRFQQINQILDTQQAKGFAAALDLDRSGKGQETMDHIRKSVDELQMQLSNEQTTYLEHQHSLQRTAFIVFAVGTVVMVLVLFWLYNALLHFIQAREQLNAELEARIDERTRELKEINEELQQFAYVASHDLQEPLRTITSFTQLLANRYRGRLDEDADEFIGYIVSSSKRMGELISGLLALVRLRREGQSTIPVPFEKLLEEAKTSLQAAIRETNARVEHGPLPALAVNKVQFSQLLQNLISNAIKYRRQEPPLIRVEAKRDSSTWIFSVADNGQGFEQQYAERIFGLFQRLHGRDVEGTGMGLSISRRIVERHGGHIWAESKPGAGSTFYFSLPVSLEMSRDSESSEPLQPVTQVH